ncbi:Toll/interleukin-1 receptor domain-containing protein [Tanacetum coccineum]
MTANLKLTEEKTWRGNKGLDKTRESDVSKGHEEERRRRWGEEIGDGERERRGSEEGVVREEGDEVVGVGVGEMEGERGEGGAEEMEPSFGDGGDGGGGGGGGWEIMRGEMTWEVVEYFLEEFIAKNCGCDRYMRDYEAYQHFVALCEQEAGGSSSGPTRRRTYIPCEREDAEQRLMDDYFGDDEFLPKYPEENFGRRYRMSSTLFNKIVNNILSYDVEPIPEYFTYFRQRHDATGRLSIGHILKCTSTIRQLAYDTAPDAFDEYLQIAEHFTNVLYGFSLFDDELADRASECPFVVNRHTYRKGYYLADSIYPTWSTFVKTVSIARDEKTLKFKRVQEGARKNIERDFGVLQGRWEIIRQPARAYQINTLKRIMYCCIILMILDDEGFEVNMRDLFVSPEPNIQRTWLEDANYILGSQKNFEIEKCTTIFDKTL